MLLKNKSCIIIKDCFLNNKKDSHWRDCLFNDILGIGVPLDDLFAPKTKQVAVTLCNNYSGFFRVSQDHSIYYKGLQLFAE